MARKNKNGNKSAKNASNSTALVPTVRTMFPPNKGSRQGTKMVVSTGRFKAVKKGRSKVPTSLPPVLGAYIDPWSDVADGVRYPDEFRGYSGTFSSTFEARLTTPGAAGTFTDANMVGVTPSAGTALALFTPDPSLVMVTGVCGTNSVGTFAGVPNTFSWPNGIAFDNSAGAANSFGPSSGLLNTDINFSNIGAFRNMYSSARLVSGGVRLNGTMNYSTVSGTVHIVPVFINMTAGTSTGASPPGVYANPTLVGLDNSWQANLPANLQDMCNLPGYDSFPLSALQSDDVCAIFKRIGSEALLFKSVAKTWGLSDAPTVVNDLTKRKGATNTPDNYGHYCILVYIDGVLDASGGPPAALTSLLEFELRNHYECQFNAASTLQLGGIAANSAVVSQAPPYQPLLMAAIDNLASDIPAVRLVDDAGVSETAFVKEVGRAWKSAVSVAGSVATAIEVGAGLLAMLGI